MKRSLEPKGFDVDGVYNINLSMKKNYIEKPDYEETLSRYWTLIDRIEKYPEIESYCVSIAAMPYSDIDSNSGCFIDTASIAYVQIKTVTSGYFDVFKIEDISGDLSEWDNASNNSNIISGDKNNIFLDMPVNQIKTFKLGTKNDYQELKITGTAAPVKRSEFDKRKPVLYRPLSKDDKRIVDWGSAEISVRVKAGFEKEFASRFSKNMQEQLSIDPYYLSSVTSIAKQRDNYIKWNGYDNNFKSILSVSSFLLLNIFLAVIGTFS
jgi:putative ABC transport system permease protein